MFTGPLKRAYLLTQSLKIRAYLLVTVLRDAFYAKLKGVTSQHFLEAQPPDALLHFSWGYLCHRTIAFLITIQKELPLVHCMVSSLLALVSFNEHHIRPILETTLIFYKKVRLSKFVILAPSFNDFCA